MNSHLGPGSLLELLAPSVKSDPALRAAAQAVDEALAPLIRAVPKLLLWARLYGDETQLTPSMRRLTEYAGGLPPLSDAELELLAWQMHVDFWETEWPREKKMELVRTSTAWHRIKGTPAAVERALALYDVAATVDESGRGDKWAIYELQLDRAPQEGELADIARVAQIAAPQRCRLRRVYGGFDRRPIVLDVGPVLDVGFLDDDSGVWDDVTGIKQSFGGRSGIIVRPARPPYVAVLPCTTSVGHIRYLDKPLLDIWRLDNPTVKNGHFTGSAVASLRNETVTGPKYDWTGEWDHRRWNENDGNQAPRPIPRRHMLKYTRIWKSQFALDCSALDDTLQRPDHEFYTAVEGVQRLDRSRLDAGLEELQVREVDVDERVICKQGVIADGSSRKALTQGSRIQSGVIRREPTRTLLRAVTWRDLKSGILCMAAPYMLPGGTEWTGPWSHRAWNMRGRKHGILVKSSTLPDE